MSAEETKRRGTVSLDADVMDRLFEEQYRLRALEGKKLSYSEILRRALKAYSDGPQGTAKKPAKKA